MSRMKRHSCDLQRRKLFDIGADRKHFLHRLGDLLNQSRTPRLPPLYESKSAQEGVRGLGGACNSRRRLFLRAFEEKQGERQRGAECRYKCNHADGGAKSVMVCNPA
jgi:hypothetical protein